MELQRLLIKIEKTRTRETVKNILGETFNKAIALRLLDFNPMLAVEIPKHKRKLGSALSDDEQRNFLKAIEGHKLEKFFKFCLYTGCRRGEALSLYITDVDYTNRILHIRGTKTTLSNRFIPLFDNVAELVRSIPSSGKLFDFRADYPTHEFKKLCPAHKLHDLRHTFATKCLTCGVAMKVVQEWLGHSEIDTTANIYSHVTKEMHFKEAEKLKNG